MPNQNPEQVADDGVLVIVVGTGRDLSTKGKGVELRSTKWQGQVVTCPEM